MKNSAKLYKLFVMTTLIVFLFVLMSVVSDTFQIHAADGTEDILTSADVQNDLTYEDVPVSTGSAQSNLMSLLTEGYTPYVIITVITIVITFIRMKINEHRKD